MARQDENHLSRATADDGVAPKAPPATAPYLPQLRVYLTTFMTGMFAQKKIMKEKGQEAEPFELDVAQVSSRLRLFICFLDDY